MTSPCGIPNERSTKCGRRRCRAGHDLGNAARLGGLELRIGIAMPLTTPTVSTDAAKLSALRRTKFIAMAALALCVAVFAVANIAGAALARAWFRRRLRRGRHHWRDRRLVRGGGAVQAPARPAHPAHGHHSGEPEPHRRQSRPLHRGQFPGAGAGARKAQPKSILRPWSPTGCATPSAPPACRASSPGWCPRRSAAIEQSGLRGFVTQPHAGADRQGRRSRRSAAELLSAFTDDRRHQKLLDEPWSECSATC